MRVTMMGISGAGKTSYMAGLAQKMGAFGSQGFTISPAAEGAVSSALSRAEEMLNLQFAANDFQFPVGTTATTNWSFSLLKDGKDVCYFEWIDFRGGYLDQLYDGLNSGSKEEIEGFLSYVQASDAIILFVDSVRLVKYHKNPAALEHFTKINSIFRFLIGLSHETPEKTIIIVGSKADSDLIDPKLQKDNFAGINEIIHSVVKEVLSPLLDKSWKAGICSVGSVGVGKVRSTEIQGKSFKDPSTVATTIVDFPEPMNVEAPLLYCLLQELRRTAELGHKRVIDNQYYLGRARAEKSLAKYLISRIKGVPTRKEQINQYEQMIEQECATLGRFVHVIPEIERIIRGSVKPVSL